jgi:hypothetical protein
MERDVRRRFAAREGHEGGVKGLQRGSEWRETSGQEWRADDTRLRAQHVSRPSEATRAAMAPFVIDPGASCAPWLVDAAKLTLLAVACLTKTETDGPGVCVTHFRRRCRPHTCAAPARMSSRLL